MLKYKYRVLWSRYGTTGIRSSAATLCYGPISRGFVYQTGPARRKRVEPPAIGDARLSLLRPSTFAGLTEAFLRNSSCADAAVRPYGNEGSDGHAPSVDLPVQTSSADDPAWVRRERKPGCLKNRGAAGWPPVSRYENLLSRRTIPGEVQENGALSAASPISARTT